MMELYIPPPPSYLPRPPPLRPPPPTVPIVPPPADLPDVLHAPEGPYTKNNALFPYVGNPAPPLTVHDPARPPLGPSSSYLGGAGGFVLPPSAPGQPAGGQTSMSWGSTLVNGVYQPQYPVLMTFANVYFPPKGGAERGIGNLLGMSAGGSAGGAGAGGPGGSGVGAMSPTAQSSAQWAGYEPSVNSDSSSPPSSENPPPPVEVPLAALPQTTPSKRNPFGKSSSNNAAAAGYYANLPRPRNNLRSSNSSFVTRLTSLDNLPKVMAEKGKAGGEMVRWGFWNLGRTVGWGEEGGKIKEVLARVSFAQTPTALAVSQVTASPDRLDVVIGFATGDIVWVDFIIGRYTRINKGGLLNETAVTGIHFDPRQPQHFVATFGDSTVLQFNLFAEDPAVPKELATPWVSQFEHGVNNLSASVISSKTDSSASVSGKSDASGSAGEDHLFLWKNEEWGVQASEKDKKEKFPWAGKNPTAALKVGTKPLTTIAYSPDGRVLAAISDDGTLKLIDVHEERLTDIFASYFGRLNCVTWSPDSRFIAVGGEDDLITIFSSRESRIVARCQGHTSFVTGIAFDNTLRGEGRGYRFGSVGEDGKLLFWDFTAASLHRPRHHHSNSSHHRITPGSTVSLTQSRSHLPALNAIPSARFHPAPPMDDVALLQPVLARIIEGNILTSVHMTAAAVVTVSRSAVVKFWGRPPRTSAASSAAARNGLKSPRERE